MEAPVIGTVCMDMTMIDVTDIAGAKEGDDVIIFGNGLPVQEVAKLVTTIPYEIMTSVSGRVKRVYYYE
jgi:alanine racemase